LTYENALQAVLTHNEKPDEEDPFEDKSHHNPQMYESYTAHDLAEMELVEPDWAIKGFLPPGLVLLAGEPKGKKSWLALNLCLNVTTGVKALGFFDLESITADAIYIAFEDTKYRLKRRLTALLSYDSDCYAPKNLILIHKSFPTLKSGGIDEIINLLNQNPATKLLVVDTLERFICRPRSDSYSLDYKMLSELQDLAQQFNIVLLVIHHTNKAPKEKAKDKISGTYGLAASADTLMVLDYKNASYILTIEGRDIDQSEYAMKFDKDTGIWTIIGHADEVARSKEQEEILNVLKGENMGMTPKEVSNILSHRTHNAIRAALSRMHEKGLLEKIDGKYTTKSW
jgi:hypothetical protein